MEKLLKEIREKLSAFYLNASYCIDVDNDAVQSLARNTADELIDLLHEYIDLVDGEDEEPDLPEEGPLIRFKKPDEEHLRR